MSEKNVGGAPEPRRPSASDQRRQARGLTVAAAALLVVLLGVGGALLALAFSQTSGAPTGGVLGVIREMDAPAQSGQGDGDGAGGADAPAANDPRAASLALDPSAQTDWKTDGTGEKTVYLTFDDGPSKNTQRVLDVLDRYGVKATFFVTGHEPDYRPMIKRAYDDGNSIGLHTMTHDYAQVYSSEDAYFSDLDQVGQVVKDQIGFVPYLVRFPGGASNTVSASYCPGIMTALSTDLTARGYQYYDWNVSSGDAAGNNVPVDKIVSSSCVEGYTNVMLLFHDAGTKDTTVDALPQIIEFYQARGYKFAPIDRDGFVCHHHINN